MAYPPVRLYFRAFKKERKLEVWGSDDRVSPMKLLQTYPIVGMSGKLGPKRKEGDRQVPEGFYRVDRFNPNSKFHLSLGIDYPNASDRKRGDPKAPRGDIFIHGDTRSIGCLAMTNEKIDEIYLLALGAQEAGQSAIAVHIFPSRLDEAGWEALRKAYSSSPDLIEFWKGLRPAYELFEQTRFPPRTGVLADGSYRVERGRP